jgi:chromosome partitioning protein
MRARIVTFVNQKGGVGKTTTALNTGAGLARLGQRVVLVDLDPQANATSALGVTPTDGPGVYQLLMGLAEGPECISEVPGESLKLIPSSSALAGAEVELVPLLARERRLASALEPLRADFDWILVDCPPSLGLLTINALTAADSVIIPVQCEYMALEGLSRLMETLELVRRNLNPTLGVLGVVLTMFDPRTRLSQQVVDEVRGHFKDVAFTTVIPRAVRLSEAPSHGRSIFEYEPGGRGANAYEALAAELLARVSVPA